MTLISRLGWATLLLATGAWQLSTAWSGPTAAVVFGVAVVGPLLLIAAGSRLRLPSFVVALALIVGCLAAGYRWAVPDGVAPTAALRDTVARLLTEQRPAPASPELLAPGVLLVVVVATWVAVRTVRTRGRGAGLVAAPVGAVALYTAAALLTAGKADPKGYVAGAIVVLAAAGWFVLDLPRPPSVATGARFVPTAALAAAVAIGFSLAWVGGAGFDPRRLVDPPGRTVSESSPLPRIAAWQQQGDTELLRANIDAGTRLRLVVLSEYTGATWSATATYLRPGAAAENPLPVAHQTTVSAQVSITGLNGPWLPTPGRAVSVSLSDVDIEPGAGSLAVREGALRPGMSYSVRAVLDSPRAEEVAAAGVPSDASVSQLLEVPRLPRVFADYARRVTYGASTPFEQAVAIEFAVRDGGRVDATAPVGSSYARLETFLFRTPGSEPGVHAGTSEQFATAFAVLARSVGLPTRVVVGFAGGTQAPDGTWVVRGRDAQAWPEVYFAGLGWYGFDPTPSAAGRSNSDEQLKLNVLDRMGEQVERMVLAPTPEVSPGSVTPTTPAVAAVRPSPGMGPVISQVAVGAGIGVLAYLAIIWLARSLRRRRHKRAGDRGAWSEVVDLMVLLGRPPPVWRPAPEVAADLAGLVPVTGDRAHPGQIIAAAADRAAFAPPGGPGAGAGVWPALRDLRRAVRAAVPLRRRLAWPVDPRPLLTRRRRPSRR
jgi:transglutaminase-like putative cysteine protease